jgi:Xaa-Pro aminopeptidase
MDEPIPLADAPTAAENTTDGAALGTQHLALNTSVGRRAEIDAKQEQVAALLAESGAEALLLIDPANVAWFCGAALAHGIPDIAEWPAVYLTATGRWLVCGNLDSQKLFDEYLDGLGFQLKEWPWHWGRDRLFNDLRQLRRMACDRVVPETLPLGLPLRRFRCTLTEAEQVRLRELGAATAHALEATCRSLQPGETEQAVAGQLTHRLLQHGIQSVTLSVAADGRASRHPRPGVTNAPIQSSCLVEVTAMRHGLHVTAGRTVSFGPPSFRAEFDAACRIAAALVAAGKPGMTAAAVLEASERVAHLVGRDDDWRITPPGHVTGWLPVERPLLPDSHVLQPGWAISWRTAIGPAVIADTYLVADQPSMVTPCEPGLWPLMRITVQGITIDVPDVLARSQA